VRLGSLFSGYGGLDLAVEEVYGARTVWHAELDPNPARVLARHWPGVPNLGDVTAYGDPDRLFAPSWSEVEPVDIVCGGFPCQDISRAGTRAGLQEGNRSGLWHTMADAVRHLRPRLVVVENVDLLLHRGIDVVLGDLAQLGYDAQWVSVRASDAGAPHRRARIFLTAAPHGDQLGRPRVATDNRPTRPLDVEPGHDPARRRVDRDRPMDWGPYADAVERWADIIGRPAPVPDDPAGRLRPAFAEWMMGLPAGWVSDVLEQTPALKALGNGVVPQQAAHALRLLEEMA
jgi:DNA (cytosine-5)-methyltransferase 1